MRILCRTLFDCTCTGVTGNFKITQLPFVDNSGQQIETQRQWNQARNQQRNWETVLQLLSLRAQPTVSLYPVNKQGTWRFVFEIETPGVYSSTGDLDDYSVLLSESQGIPMILGLGEEYALDPCLHGSGAKQNIWFETVNN